MLNQSHFDEDTLADMLRYGGRDLFEAQDFTERVFREAADATWTLAEFAGIIETSMAAIPDQFRSTAKVELETEYENGAFLQIVYTRPETAAEVDDRVKHAAAYVHRQRETERLTFERLKAKFGP